MKSLKFILTLCLGLFSITTYGQYTDVINSNRPGVSKSAFAVGRNVYQLEVGPYYVEERHNNLNREVIGGGVDFSARYGLKYEELEINVEGAFQEDTYTENIGSTPKETKRGNFKYLTAGVKYLIFDPYKNGEDAPNVFSYKANHRFKWKSLLPAVSIYAGAHYDTKNNPYITNGIEGFSPKVMIATQNHFSGGWVMIANVIKDRIGTEQSDLQYLISFTNSVSAKLAIFGEYHGIISDFYSDNLYRFGAGFLAAKNLQLDTAITFNSKITPSVLNATLGVSYRLDKHEDRAPETKKNKTKSRGNHKRNGGGRSRRTKSKTDFQGF